MRTVIRSKTTGLYLRADVTYPFGKIKVSTSWTNNLIEASLDVRRHPIPPEIVANVETIHVVTTNEMSADGLSSTSTIEIVQKAHED